ncbi:hypothetical protein NEOKW01_0679 [Nematocida sp. AWRm80]|nr:hypothetical protein NEOKW01_0679 [Nematocida sp. AWRm80]
MKYTGCIWLFLWAIPGDQIMGALPSYRDTTDLTRRLGHLDLLIKQATEAMDRTTSKSLSCMAAALDKKLEECMSIKNIIQKHMCIKEYTQKRDKRKDSLNNEEYLPGNHPSNALDTLEDKKDSLIETIDDVANPITRESIRQRNRNRKYPRDNTSEILPDLNDQELLDDLGDSSYKQYPTQRNTDQFMQRTLARNRNKIQKYGPNTRVVVKKRYRKIDSEDYTSRSDMTSRDQEYHSEEESSGRTRR